MAGNIAHMVICKKALRRLSGLNSEYESFTSELFGDNFSNLQRLIWANLGSLAPDLFYYDNPRKTIWLLYTEKHIGAERLEPWSYHMHSIRPNELPLQLIDITFRDALIDSGRFILDDIDYKKLCFIAGYLTHIATDQVIHKSANKISGPYYRDGINRNIHRRWEIQFDYHLYQSYCREHSNAVPFDQQDFSTWAYYIDPSPRAIANSFINYAIRHPSNIFTRIIKHPLSAFGSLLRLIVHHATDEWFSPFFQRGFAEVYGSFPEEKKILDSAVNLNILLSTTSRTGPYKKAKTEYENRYNDNPVYQEYFTNHFETDVEAAIVNALDYLKQFYRIFSAIIERRSVLDLDRKHFLKNVSNSDLSYP